MLDAKEFQLNNLVYYNVDGNDELCRVDWIQETSITLVFVNGPNHKMINGVIVRPEHINPIEITPDILRKIEGFVEEDGYFEYVIRRDQLRLYMHTERYKTNHVQLLTEDDFTVKTVKHLHRLQNLVFWLHNHTLQINLKKDAGKQEG